MTRLVFQTLKGLRPWLWCPIIVNSVVMTMSLGNRMFEGLELSVSLCMIASAGFLLNDVCDKPIDRINRANRFEALNRRESAFMLAFAGVLAFLAIGLATVLGPLAFSIAALLAVGVAVYSLLARPILLFANIFAALLAASPLWVPCLLSPLSVTAFHWGTAGAMTGVLVAREIVLDIKDLEGDLVSRRVTFATAFGDRVSLVTALILSIVALCAHGGLVAMVARVLAPLPTAALCVVFLAVVSLIEWPLLNLVFRGPSRLESFCRSSRIAMVLVPAMLLIEWLVRR